MPCICHGAVTGKEEFDKFIQSPQGVKALEMLRESAKLINVYPLALECYKENFQLVFFEAFYHMLNGCEESNRLRDVMQKK